jgi:hypothetical protein
MKSKILHKDNYVITVLDDIRKDNINFISENILVYFEGYILKYI